MQTALATIATPNEPAAVPQMLVSFRVGQQLFALPVGLVKDALRQLATTNVPLAAEGIAGIAAHAGKTVTVLDLRSCFGMEKRAGAAHAVLLVAHAEEEFALVVDKIEDLIEAAEEDFIPVPPTMEEGWQRVTAQIVRHNGGLLAMLSLDGVLSALQQNHN